jgi:death-on-curing protein
MVRDEALLESALALPRQPYYRTTLVKSAALLRSLVKNHAYVDGNKRVGAAVTLAFLALNGRRLTASEYDLEEFIVDVASHYPSMSLEEIAAWLRAHSATSEERRRGGLRAADWRSSLAEWSQAESDD